MLGLVHLHNDHLLTDGLGPNTSGHLLTNGLGPNTPTPSMLLWPLEANQQQAGQLTTEPYLCVFSLNGIKSLQATFQACSLEHAAQLAVFVAAGQQKRYPSLQIQIEFIVHFLITC